MDDRVNRAWVGAFVLLLTAGGIAAALWLGSGRLSRKAYDTYAAYFTESVAGLGLRSPVKLRGVEVGTVRAIAIDRDDPGRVRVELAIERGTPVREDTHAELKSQGLTGIAFIELGGGSRTAPELRAGPGEAFPVIPTRPSFLARLDVDAASLSEDLTRILRTVARRSDELDRAVVAGTEMLENGARASAELPAVVERLGRAAGALERMGNELAGAGGEARAAVQEVRGTLGQARDAVPDVRRLVADLRTTSASLGRVVSEVERDPSLLVAGRAVPAPGPGE